MRAQWMLRDILPPIAGLQVSSPRRIERIKDPTARLRRLPTNQEPRLTVAVVDEAVADPGAGGKRGQVTGHHAVQVSVNPGVHLSVDYVDKLLLVFFSMGPRRARAGRQALHVDSDAHQAGSFSNAAVRSHLLGTLRIHVRALGDIVS